MSEIKIKCPTCGKILRLTDMPNINAASFTCPVCKDRHKVGECQRYVEQPRPAVSGSDETRYGNASAPQRGGDETRIGSQQSVPGEGDETLTDPQTAAGMLVDGMGRTYRLCPGINTIGRKASSSTATVQIVTDDRTMSRSHAVVEVRNAGGRIIRLLKNGANKNPSTLNGTLIGQQDQFILNDGDRIKMGETELTFKL